VSSRALHLGREGRAGIKGILKKAAIVGGGFWGEESAESFRIGIMKS